MTQTVIPTEFELYLQNKITAGETPDMNQMVFAYIPDLDIELAIDRGQSLAEEQYWVHAQDIDQVSKLNDNAVVYSVVVSSSVDAFTFNAIYLHDKNTENSCGMIIHKAEETKASGMTTTRTLVLQYNGAALLTQINVSTETWQIDYQARLLGIEEDHRLACLESYGKTAFIEGFDITQDDDPNQYNIAPGVAYLGGLRVALNAESMQTITTATHIYLDVYRSGTVLSKWANEMNIRLSEIELNDYIDSTGVPHYVAKLASINADGDITDVQVESTGMFERANKPKPSITQSIYSFDDETEGIQRDTICENGFLTREIWVTVTVENLAYGEIYNESIEFEGAQQIQMQISTTRSYTDAKAYKSGDYMRFTLSNLIEENANAVTANIYICALYTAGEA